MNSSVTLGHVPPGRLGLGTPRALCRFLLSLLSEAGGGGEGRNFKWTLFPSPSAASRGVCVWGGVLCAFLISTSVSTSPLNLWEDSPGELANWPRRRAQVGGGVAEDSFK